MSDETSVIVPAIRAALDEALAEGRIRRVAKTRYAPVESGS